MCGIVGIIKKEVENSVSENRLRESASALLHRGPDKDGFFVYKNIGFGHKRLKIIDLESGQQPMIDKSSGNTIVFNGEIYNYIELKETLVKKGHVFVTNSDTEVILKGYLEWGEDVANYLNGMWAFAIYDMDSKKVFMSRDRIGEKPLFYFESEEEFIFASEIKAILKVTRGIDINLDFLQAYFVNLNVPAPYTFYKDIYQLMPGHNLVITEGKKTFKKYWELPNVGDHELRRNEKEVLSQFEELFQDSVRIRMRADVPFGAFLSGGLDSSLIVSVMNKFSENSIHTFTMGFNDKSYDERDLARLVAEKFNTQHTEKIIDINTVEDPIALILKYFDQPFGDSSAIPTYFVSKAAKEHITMVLTGDGGDEVLSGYKTYKKLELLNRVNKFPNIINDMTKKGIHVLSNLTNSSLLKTIHSFAKNIGEDYNVVNLNNRISTLDYHNVSEFIKDNYKESNQFSIRDYYNDIIKETKASDPFYKQVRLNFYNDLPNDYLVKVDRMSMANSLETRTPFLDYRLIELLASTDKSIKFKDNTLKSVLRNSSLGKRLPEKVLKGRKSGFSIPLKNFNKQYIEKENLLTSIKQISQKLSADNKHSKADENLIWASLVLNGFLKKNDGYE